MKDLIAATAAFMLVMGVAATTRADTGIIVALEATLQEFLQGPYTFAGAIEKAGRDFHFGRLDGEKIVMVRSPMGKVNNAITAQILITRFAVDRVYSISPCGALSDNLKTGDVVVAGDAYQHDFGTVKPYGFVWNRTPVRKGVQEEEYNKLDASLVKSTVETANSLKLGSKVKEGTLVSGDQFIASLEKKVWLRNKFGAIAVDMGGAAIAQVCYSNKVRCCLLRVVTDRAEVGARGDFAGSVSPYLSDIDLPRLIAASLRKRNVQETRQ